MDPNLKKLCKLVDFGFDCMKAANIPSLRRLRGAKQHLFMLVVAAHSYCESVCVLCKQTRTPAASVLLRSLCDSLIKAQYLYCNPRLHVWELRLEAFIEKRKQLNGMNGFLLGKKLNARVSAEVSVAEIQDSLQRVRCSIEYCESSFRNHGGGFDKKGQPSLKGILGKAEYVDKYNSDKGLQSESLEYFYDSVYRNLSSSVHLDGRNFPEFNAEVQWQK